MKKMKDKFIMKRFFEFINIEPSYEAIVMNCEVNQRWRAAKLAIDSIQ